MSERNSRLAPLSIALLTTGLLASAASAPQDLEKFRDAQDRSALDRAAHELAAAAEKQPNDAAAQYRAALVHSYAADVAMEVRDKNASKSAAEIGIRFAEKAVALKGNNSEYHRILGTLCGQVIPANVLSGLKYGRCALDEVNRAIELDPKSSIAYLSRGVGNYYLPATFGGGVDKAIPDFQKSIALDPNLAEAHLWLGIALRKANRNAEARKAIEKSLQLNPKRLWAKQQLDKTPAK